MRVKTAVIQRERVRRGWTQTELARRIDTPQTLVSRVERGKNKSPKILYKLANLFGITVDDLIED